MRTAVTVVGRKLQLHGAIHGVGERLVLDTDNAQDRECMERGWVTRDQMSDLVAMGGSHGPAPIAATAVAAPPRDKMLDAAQAEIKMPPNKMSKTSHGKQGR